LIGAQEQIELGLGGVSLRALIAARHHILLEGAEASTEAVLLALAPHLGGTVLRRPPGTVFAPPTGEVGAVILHSVDGLSASDQTTLLGWLADARRRTRIVSTTVHSLFALVGRGLFDAHLYYRLNEVLLHVDGK
jgi:Sigma-54 interaction domain